MDRDSDHYTNDMEAHRSPIAPELERWSEAGSGDDRRTVIVRFGNAADPARAAEVLGSEGLVVQSAGPGSVIGVATPAVLRRLVRTSWVVAIEEPRRLFPKTAPRVRF